MLVRDLRAEVLDVEVQLARVNAALVADVEVELVRMLESDLECEVGVVHVEVEVLGAPPNLRLPSP